jgi:hypothetical protein
VLLVVLAAGFEALRRQIEGEWPDAKDPDWGGAARDIRDGVASFFGGARSALSQGGGRAGDEGERRLEQLERLGRLRETKVLTEREFAAEKKRILSSGNGANGAPHARRSGGRRAASPRK